MRRIRPFRHLQLSEKDSAGLLEPVHHGRVEGWNEALEDPGSGRSRREGRVTEILDGDGHAMEWSAPETPCEFRVSRLGLAPCALGKNGCVRAIAPVELGDAPQKRFSDLRRRQLLSPNEIGDARQRLIRKIWRHRGVLLQFTTCSIIPCWNRWRYSDRWRELHSGHHPDADTRGQNSPRDRTLRT